MSSQHIAVIAPPAITPPRGAQWAATAALWIVQKLSSPAPDSMRRARKLAP